LSHAHGNLSWIVSHQLYMPWKCAVETFLYSTLLNPLIYSTKSLPTIRPLLRMATKYCVLRIRTAIVESIEIRYPTEWLKAPVLLPEPLPPLSSTILLAYDCSLYETLPWMLYYASRIGNDLKELPSMELALITHGQRRMLEMVRKSLSASQDELERSFSACISLVPHVSST
jgi:hypothetical protein